MTGIEAMVRQMLGAEPRPRTRPPGGGNRFPLEVREAAAQRVWAGEKPSRIAREVGVGVQTIRNWARALSEINAVKPKRKSRGKKS